MAEINERLMSGAGLAELWGIISNKYGNIVNHCWRCRAVEDGYVIGSQSSSSNTNVNGTWYYASSYTISNDGKFVLDNPESVTISFFSATPAEALQGMYRIQDAAEGDVLYYSSATATPKVYADSTGSPSYVGMPSTKYTLAAATVSGDWSLVFSEDRNAFPDNGIVAGAEYLYAGTPLENAGGALKIQTGSYVGTGTTKEANPCVLTFDIDPKLVIIAAELNTTVAIFPAFKYTPAYLSHAYIACNTSYPDFELLASAYAKKEGSTMSWYTTSSSGTVVMQVNEAGVVYHWLAIG